MTTLRNSNNELRIRMLIAVALPIALASWIIPSAVCAPGSVQNPASGGRLVLREGWQVQTSTGQADGAVISKAGFAVTGWYPTAIPATVSRISATGPGCVGVPASGSQATPRRRGTLVAEPSRLIQSSNFVPEARNSGYVDGDLADRRSLLVEDRSFREFLSAEVAEPF